MKGNLVGVRLTEGFENLHAAANCQRGDFTNKAALTDTRWSYQPDHRAVAVDCSFQQSINGRHLPSPTDQCRLVATYGTVLLPMRNRRRAETGSSAPLICTSSGSPRTAVPSTSRAVEALSITAPGGAIDSIRCALPTCSPIVV